MKKERLLFLVQTQPGFETIVADQLAELPERAVVRSTHVVEQKNGMLLFEYDGDVEDLAELRTIEDLFVVLATIDDMPPVYAGLDLLQRAALKSNLVEPALKLLRQLHPRRSVGGKLLYRVIARHARQTTFRRVDAQRSVERGISLRTDHKWRLVEDDAQVEFWLTLLPETTILALRLSDQQMRQRGYKQKHLAASLRPSVAATLAWLSGPRDDDVFLDPMCGAGTILIERAHLGRYQQLLGGDLREEALAAARENIGARYQPLELRLWDARQLPLDPASVSAAAVNLPFGKQIGSTAANRTLYPQFLAEMARVLRPGARLALLTGDWTALGMALKRTPQLQRLVTYRVRLLGEPASVYVLRRS